MYNTHHILNRQILLYTVYSYLLELIVANFTQVYLQLYVATCMYDMFFRAVGYSHCRLVQWLI